MSARNFLDKCANDTEWWAGISKEMNAWKHLAKNHKIISMDEILSLANGIVDNRESKNNLTNLCWKTYSVFEVMEGTAKYVDSIIGLKAKYSNLEEVLKDYLQYMDFEKPNITESQLFYGNGAMYSFLLNKIDNSKDWQRHIAIGASFDSALEAALKQKIKLTPKYKIKNDWCNGSSVLTTEEQLLRDKSAQSYEENPNIKKWKLVDENTLRFDGAIERGEFDKFLNVYTQHPKINTIILNSVGGTTSEAIKIANRIIQRRLKIVIDGHCGSSCANYLFNGGFNKEIKFGFVGFHGNVTAFINSTTPEQRLNMIKDSYDQFNVPYTEASLQEAFLEDESYAKKEISWESELFKNLTISQELFDLTQKVDKGVGDNNDYEFLALDLSAFKFFGIDRIELPLEQDLCFAQKLYGKTPLLSFE